LTFERIEQWIGTNKKFSVLSKFYSSITESRHPLKINTLSEKRDFYC